MTGLGTMLSLSGELEDNEHLPKLSVRKASEHRSRLRGVMPYVLYLSVSRLFMSKVDAYIYSYESHPRHLLHLSQACEAQAQQSVKSPETKGTLPGLEYYRLSI